MTDESISDWWFTLEAKASSLLRDRGPTRRGFSCLLRFLVKPSFEPWSAYELHVPTVPPLETCLGFVTAWDHPTDRRELQQAIGDNPVVRLRRYAALKPSLTRTEVQLSRDGVESLVRAVNQQVLPAVVSEARVGLDGTSYEIIFGRGFVESRFRWWLTPPDEWKGLGELGNELVSAIETARRGAG